MDPARIHREPDVENLRTDFIGCPSLLTRHAKKKKKIHYEPQKVTAGRYTAGMKATQTCWRYGTIGCLKVQC